MFSWYHVLIPYQNYPFHVLGTSSPTGKFFALGAAVASNEDAETWSTIFRYIKDLGNTPKILLADGATAITKAIEQTYGGETIRIMCYPYVYRNVTPQLKGISSY